LISDISATCFDFELQYSGHRLNYVLFFYGTTDPSRPLPPHYRGFAITFRKPHSVLWTRDRPDAGTSTWYTTLTTYRLPCPPAGFEPPSPSKGEATDPAATNIGLNYAVSLHCHSESSETTKSHVATQNWQKDRKP